MKIKLFKSFHIYINVNTQLQILIHLFLQEVILQEMVRLVLDEWEWHVIQRLFNHALKNYRNSCAIQLVSLWHRLIRWCENFKGNK